MGLGSSSESNLEDVMEAKGSCHCGAISYAVAGEPVYHAMCHCSDCRRASGAPAVSWALFAQDAVAITGAPQVYASSDNGRRQFCRTCGTSLFYTNDQVFPGLIDIQSATLDDPGALPLQVEVQMSPLHGVAQFERYPAPPSD
jgi:hypothetical protein